MRDVLILSSALVLLAAFAALLYFYRPTPPPPPPSRRADLDRIGVAFRGLTEAVQGMRPAFEKAATSFKALGEAAHRTDRGPSTYRRSTYEPTRRKSRR